MSRAPALDSSTSGSTIPVRFPNSLGRLNQNSAQADLFESLLKLQSFQAPSVPPEERTEKRESDSLFPAVTKEPSSSQEQEKSSKPESDHEVSLSDGPGCMLSGGQLAICYGYPPSKPVEGNGEQPKVEEALKVTQGSESASIEPAPKVLEDGTPATSDPGLLKPVTEAEGDEAPKFEVPASQGPSPVETQVNVGQSDLTPKEGSSDGKQQAEEGKASLSRDEGPIRSGRAPIETKEELTPNDTSLQFQGEEGKNGRVQESQQETDRPMSKREMRLERDKRDSRDVNSPSAVERAGDANNSWEHSKEGNLVDGGARDLSTTSPPVESVGPAVEVLPASVVDTSTVPNASLAAAVSNAVATARVVDASAVGNLGNTEALNSINAASGATTQVARDVNAPREMPLGSSSLTPRQEIRLVQRLLRGFEQLSSGEGQVKLRLHPPELGSLQMTLKVEGQVMTAKLEVENALAKDALTQNVQQLRDRLAEQGIRIERFEVQIVSPNERNALGNQPQSDFSGQSAEQGREQSQRQRQAAWQAANRLDTGSRPNEASSAAPRRAWTGRGLDLTA